mgnify:FL=1
MINSNIFPQRLKELRLKKGLTQTELGEKVGVKQNTYTNWENGKREPNFETLLKLASILNTTTSYLLGESDIQYGYGSKEFEEYIQNSSDIFSEIFINQTRDTMRALPYLAKKEGKTTDEVFREITENMSEQGKKIATAFYLTETIENITNGNNSETTETK